MFPHDYNCMTVLSSFEIFLAEDSVPWLHLRYFKEAPRAGQGRLGGRRPEQALHYIRLVYYH